MSRSIMYTVRPGGTGYRATYIGRWVHRLILEIDSASWRLCAMCVSQLTDWLFPASSGLLGQVRMCRETVGQPGSCVAELSLPGYGRCHQEVQTTVALSRAAAVQACLYWVHMRPVVHRWLFVYSSVDPVIDPLRQKTLMKWSGKEMKEAVGRKRDVKVMCFEKFWHW